ncbi:MAG: YqeG family HAD IIIA-type phosphatase [Thermoanaerobacterales bacterium]|nr:YqeG family HAD IIIA-type phosphatase [Thermoanaerobacterales bacterium]
MFQIFLPDLYVNDIYQLKVSYFINRNIKGILIDLDNTLLPWDSYNLNQGHKEWIEQFRLNGISVCIISNNKSDRVNKCARILNIPAVSGPLKPSKSAFLKGLKILGTTPEQTASIGDQIFTDVFGAKRMGIHAILVKPLSKKEFFVTRLMRKIERYVLKKIR